VDAPPRRLVLAAQLLFVLSGILLAAAVVCVVGGVAAAPVIADELLRRVLAEIDPEALAGLPPNFLTAATVERAAVALGAGLALLGAAQLATSIGLRRGQRWAYAAAVIGGLFVAFTTGASAVFMFAAIPTQPQAGIALAVGALVLGAVAALYAAIAVMTASGRRAWEREVAVEPGALAADR
jgi:hypothetical protein